ncbi:hypothetical protein EPI10_015910 [Gossypium australe]|uniref:Uncharacterized protein n=1 Tax=Gossypium australe TaxID=47621 RepID=A0A5B6VLR6_9ROSI|nr:hypothetical protein EPI10_015910 [Gossypium australe]
MRWKNFEHKLMRMPSYRNKRLNDGMTTKFTVYTWITCLVVHVHPHGVVEVKDSRTGSIFKVNGQLLKHYFKAPIFRDKYFLSCFTLVLSLLF